MSYSAPHNIWVSLLKALLSAVNLFLSLHLATFQERKGEGRDYSMVFALAGLIVTYYFSELCVEVIVLQLCSVVLIHITPM